MNKQTHDYRTLPTAWFLAEVVTGWPHPAFATGRHVYVSRSESGQYRMLGQGSAVMVMTEGVAKRHLRRVVGKDGLAVRVARQQEQDDRFCEAFYGRRTVTIAA